MKTRYDNLMSAVADTAKSGNADDVYCIMEVGTFNGNRAREMISKAFAAGRKKVRYWGYDLFEDMTQQDYDSELSKSTLAPSAKEVRKFILAPYKGHKLLPEVFLTKGNTRSTLATAASLQLVAPLPDLIFIDGGHSLDTVDSDWENCARLVMPTTVILLDDYYENKPTHGCQHLVASLANRPGWSVELLDPVDAPSSGLRIRMVKVTPSPKES